MINISETLAIAFEHHQAGRLTEAAQVYHQVLQQQPDQTDALQLLGIIAAQTGNPALAVTCFSQAVRVNPGIPGFHYNLGKALQDQGRLSEAILSYQQALALDSDYPGASYNLGTALSEQGLLSEAIACYRRALELNPNLVMAHNDLGRALQEQGQLEAAVACYQKALALKPNLAIAHNNLGTALQEQGQLPEAIACYRQALTLNPNLVMAHNNLGTALQEQGQLEAAMTCYQQVLALQPNHAGAYNHLGTALQEQGQLEAAVVCYHRALTLQPNDADVYNNLGKAYFEAGQLTEALTYYNQSCQLNPLDADSRWKRSLVLLQAGDLRRGFAEYEWRWQVKHFPQHPIAQPLWDGTHLYGRTILVHTEQGFGDAIQFIRYAPLVAALGGRLIVECYPPLMRLFETVSGIAELVPYNSALPEFEVQAPLMSLPYLLGTTLETIPAQVPYLTPPTPNRIQLEVPVGSKLKVGMVWASGRRTELNLFRTYQTKSCSLTLFRQFLTVPGVSLYSLQLGQDAADLVEWDQPNRPQDLSSQIQDFADTAAAIAQLDLVITVDTAVAHLAGALGKPVWVLLPFQADWRWLQQRQDSPWYPTMQLFRQKQPGDWTGVLMQVTKTLQNLVDFSPGAAND